MSGSGKKRVLGKIYVKSLEETAFLLDTFRVPGFGKQHESLIKKTYKEANRVRKIIGEPTKQYQTIKHRKVVDI